jgi:hypothetical protein
MFWGGIAVVLCGLRWVFIADGFDFGWDYETGYRVYLGGVYGKDFYTALAPLAYELIGAVFKGLGPRWFWVYPIYYGCWLLTLTGVYILFGLLTKRKEILAITLMVLAPLSIPHLSALHVYNNLSYCLAVWCSVFCFSFYQRQKYSCLLVGGALAGLTLFTKQNLGLGVVLVNIGLIFLNWLLNEKREIKSLFVTWILFVGSFSFVCFWLFNCFSREIGLGELVRLMFSDAAQAKGNLFQMLKTAVPRISFGHSEKHDRRWLLQHLAELCSYLIILFANVVCYRKWIFYKSRSEKVFSISLREVKWCFVIFFVILTLPLLFPEQTYSWRSRYFWFNENHHTSDLFLKFVFWMVVCNLGLWLWVAIKRNRRFFIENPFWIMMFGLSLGMNVLVCVSRFSYLFLNAPLLLGFFVVATLEFRLWSRHLFFCLFSLGLLGIYFFYPTHALAPLTTVRDFKTRGLLFSVPGKEYVEFYTRNIKPWVSGKRTLWLTHGGPHSLSGSLPVRNVSNLYFDQYNTRIEESLVKEWMAHPPEMIIRDWFVTPDSSVWLKGKAFENWLNEHYVQVGMVDQKNIFKLRKKE